MRDDYVYDGMRGSNMKRKILSKILMMPIWFFCVLGTVNCYAGECDEEVSGGKNGSLYGGIASSIYEYRGKLDLADADIEMIVDRITLNDNEIYSFLQGPKAWESQTVWSGEWCGKIVKGRSFGGFGCGLCCMANIYSTLSPYEVSPVGMFDFTTSVTNYYPSRESGAIGWEEMSSGLKQCGIDNSIKRKPSSYEEFREKMRENPSMIALVSSSYDDTFWKNTYGHYVNIWNYNEENDDVFLAEPGDPENNRKRIPLRYVYDALKEVSDYQYLLVKGYSEKNNTWKGNGIIDNWIRPEK